MSFFFDVKIPDINFNFAELLDLLNRFLTLTNQDSLLEKRHREMYLTDKPILAANISSGSYEITMNKYFEDKVIAVYDDIIDLL